MSAALGWQHSALPALLGSPVLALASSRYLNSFGNLAWKDMDYNDVVFSSDTQTTNQEENEIPRTT